MRIAHLADLHLGYRAYPRPASDGRNQRELDVAEAAGRAVDQVVAAGAEIVIIAGDLFHSARPSNAAIMDGFRLLRRLRAGLPSAPIILVAGAHDGAPSIEAVSVLSLLAEVEDVHVADDEARTVQLAALDATVHCVPHQALARAKAARPPAPDRAAAINVLTLHGAVAEAGVEARLRSMMQRGAAAVAAEWLRPEAWDYVALGHCHDALRIDRNAWYAGATERTSPNPWAEAGRPRGWLLFDTDAGDATFQEVAGREVVDLPPLSARADDDGWLDAGEIDRRIRAAAESLPGGVAGKVVRQRVGDLPLELFRELDHESIRRLKAEALHYQLEARRPRPGPEGAAATGPRPATLAEEVRRFLEAWEPSVDGIDRDRLVALGAEYLERP